VADRWFESVKTVRQGMLVGLAVGLTLAGGATRAAADPDVKVNAKADVNTAADVEIGRRIYGEGRVASGALLEGTRFGAVAVSGAEAACVKCHRRSGMGAVEGDILVPPISGPGLFDVGKAVMATMDPRRGKLLNQAHPPYSDATAARAMREGINVGGRQMNIMMPRYELSDADMRGLVAYLRQLSTDFSPGATDKTVRFATVLTPEVDAVRRGLLLDMMRAIIAKKNAATLPGRRYMTSAAELTLRTGRRWELDVWELQGAPESWARQLDDHYRQQPVFAVVSGISGSTWAPVQDFCEREKVPCWFPSIDVAPSQPAGFYSLYFSRGVALEADVLAARLRAPGVARPTRLVQVFRDDAVGRGAAQALAAALARPVAGLTPIEVVDRLLPQGNDAGDALAQALRGLGENDAVMFWLRPADLVGLDKLPPGTGTGPRYFSGSLARAEYQPFPANWKAAARLVYPYELPERREANLAYFRSWLKINRLPLIDEPMQSEVFFAMSFLTDTFAEMLHNLYRDYLVERAENMIGFREGSKGEQETRDRSQLGRATVRARNLPGSSVDEASELLSLANRGHTVVGAQMGTTLYPHLTLATGQRYASKGGYIVRFAESPSPGSKFTAESDWIVP
jgi:cytochrome c553